MTLGFASARIPKTSISSASPPAGSGPTCARSPRSWTRSLSARCAAGCACWAPRPGPRATPTSSPTASRLRRTCCRNRTPRASDSSFTAWTTRRARLAPRSCRSSAAPATISCWIPSWISLRGRRSPPSRPAWPAQRAADLAAALIRRSWRRLKRAAKALERHSPDTQWHAIRIRAKQCRYAAEAVAPVYGPQARRFAASVAAVQDILGDHQDTVVAEAWLRNTGAALTPACVAAGELITSMRLERARLRSKWPKAWKRASARKLHRWLGKGRSHSEPRQSIPAAPPAGQPLARTGEAGPVPSHR